jgi:hypothetical protein
MTPGRERQPTSSRSPAKGTPEKGTPAKGTPAKGSSQRPPRPPEVNQASESAKKIALYVLGGLAVVLVLLIGLRVGGVFDGEKPETKVIDYRDDLKQADELCKTARLKYDKAFGMRDRDPAGAMKQVDAAIADADKALKAYEKLLEVHEGQDYDYLSEKIEKLLQEKKSYRTLKMELTK